VEELLTVPEVARLLKRSIWSVYQDASAGRLPVTRCGRRNLRFRRADLERWLDVNTQSAKCRNGPIRAQAEES
jgi:excisionase family DNA binding protein